MNPELDIRVIPCPCCAANEDEYLSRLARAGLVIDDVGSFLDCLAKLRPKDD